jgi:hypothetical protein
MLPIIRKVSVSLKVKFDGLGTPIKVNFNQDIEELRNVRLWGVQTYYFAGKAPFGTFGTLFTDPDYKIDVISKKQFQGAFLNLYDTKNVFFLQNAPFVIFNTIQNNTEKEFFGIVERDAKNFNGQFLDLTASFVKFDGSANPLLEPAETRTIVIDFYYSRIDLDNELLKK